MGFRNNHDQRSVDTDIEIFVNADTDVDTDMTGFEIADTDMYILKNCGHGVDNPRTCVSADL